MLEQGTSAEHKEPEISVLLTTRWQEVFQSYDLNNDGMLSLPELCTAIKRDRNINNIPEETVRQIMMKADDDDNGLLSFEEFVKMIQNPENQGIFGHLSSYLSSYVRLAVPRKKNGDRGVYEKAYSCCPPALGMVIISAIEVILFLYDDLSYDKRNGEGPVAQALIYSPYKRYQAWRYATYMFVHVGSMHLIMNLIVQIMLGIPLEMVHQSWRVGVVYLAGVLAGSLGTSITSPRVFLAGASGGVYALITAHVATIIMNWKEMKYANYQLLMFLIWTVVDVRMAVYDHYELQIDSHVGYWAHTFGAIAGLFVGISVLRNLDVLSWERILRYASISSFSLLMVTLIIWNLAFPSYFQTPR